ncbi:MAG: NAD(P)-dependent alcohol dehydrogenase [Anaerolineae bacterium]|nr:NAD(P)-dependent alcohol dehydrogenase [Anaerolineae bacterium]
MKAFVFEEYGSPDVLAIKEVAKPTPKDDEVLIKVQATAVNPLDWHRLRADPFLVRFSEGLSKPKNSFIGADIAGVVETVGKNVTQFQPGDAVYGEIGSGGLAEYACAAEKVIAPKPDNISFVEAAAVPVAAFTALQSLRDHGQLQAGQTVLINGASGGIGTYAVQIAKAMGAEVTAVCSTRNLDLVQSIGADHVIDYTQADLAQCGQQFDLILDNVGNLSVAAYKRLLKDGGTAVVAGFTTMGRMFQVMVVGGISSKFGSKKIGSMLAQPNQADLLALNALLESGQVKSVIDRCYPFTEAAEAIRYLENGRARGKVVVTMTQDSNGR